MKEQVLSQVVFQALSIAVRDVCLDCIIKYPVVPKIVSKFRILGPCDNCHDDNKMLAVIRSE